MRTKEFFIFYDLGAFTGQVPDNQINDICGSGTPGRHQQKNEKMIFSKN